MGVDLVRGKVTTEKGKIPADMPVMVLCADDPCAAAAIANYRHKAVEMDDAAAIVRADDYAREFQRWTAAQEETG